MKNKTRLFSNSLGLVLAALVLAVSLVISANYAYAGSGGESGDHHGGCSSCGSSNRSTCVCNANGLRWVYYKLTSSGVNAKFDFPGRDAAGEATINGCRSGFWHLGYDIYEANEDYNDVTSWNSHGTTGSTQWRYTGSGKSGQIGSRDMNYFNNNNPDTQWGSGGSLGFELKSGGNRVAYADKYGSGSTTANNAWNTAIDADPYGIEKLDSNGNHYNPKRYYGKGDFNNVAWFCYEDDLKATFTATTVSSGDGTEGDTATVTRNNNFKMVFTHTISRTDSLNFTANNPYSSSPRRKSSVGPAAPTAQSGTWASTQSSKTKVVTDTVEKTITPGDTVEYCSKLNYYSEIHSVATDKNVSTHTTEKCRKLKRVNRTVSFSANTKVYADEGNSAVTERSKTSPYNESIAVTGEKFTVRFEHTIARGNVTGPSGYTNDDNFKVNNTYTTIVSDSGNYYSENGKSTVKSDTWSSMTKGGSHLITDQISGTIYPNQSITFCQQLEYQTSNNERNTAKNEGTTTNTSKTTKKCITITRAKASCNAVFNDTAYQYGYDRGWNIGYVTVSNKTMNTSATTSHAPNDYTTTNKINESSVWARPGDLISYDYRFCAGAQYPNLRNDAGLTIDYDAAGDTTKSTANKNKYLFDSQVTHYNTSANSNDEETKTIRQPRSWKNVQNSNTHYKNSSGKRFPYDFGGLYAAFTSPQSGYTDYSCSITGAASSADGYYQVTGLADATSTCATNTLDVGGTFSQTVKWHDLKITGATWNSTTKKLTLQKDSVHDGTKKNGAKGSVKVPYNYKLQPTISSDAEMNVAYLGSTVNFDVDVITTPRKNTSFGTDESKNTYATISKPTSISVKYYYVKRGIENYWGGHYDIETSHVTLKSDTDVRFNNKGNLGGTADVNSSVANGGYNYDTLSVYIDDSIVSVGDQVCAYVTVSPADSHDNYSSNSVSGAGTNNVALSEQGSSSNKTSRTSCYTIAKKPTMSVESSNAFAGGNKGFVTARYTKKFHNDNTEYLFGSWSEYGVYGGVLIRNGHGIASGATFGYATKGHSLGINAERENSSSSNVAKNDSAHGANTCVFSTQTFANADCESTTDRIGSTGIGQTSAQQFRDRIYDRFASSDNDAVTEDEYGGTCYSLVADAGLNNADVVLAKGGGGIGGIHIPFFPGDYPGFPGGGGGSSGASNNSCVKTKSGKKYAVLSAWINQQWDDNGVNHTFVKGNAYLGSTNSSKYTLWASHNFNNKQNFDTGDGQVFADRNYTRLIEVDGTLVLDGDIRVGDWNDGNPISDPNLHNTGEVVQFVILADKVEITSRVSQIDAIIIADEVNTCSYASLSDFGNEKKAVIGAGSSTTTSINANTCNSQLLFRGPVITKKLTLNRTYGAENEEDSAKRAEIFDLNPYTYLWSFGQMNRYSQAVTTYSRELPTRY